MQGKQYFEGVPQTDYCTYDVIQKYAREAITNETKANPRFIAKLGTADIVLVPGGLDGDADGYFWYNEVISMVKDDILPEGIQVFYQGRLCQVKEGKIIKVKQQ